MKIARAICWIGTDTSGLHVLRHQNFHTLPGTAHPLVTALTQTTDGAMWIGSNGDGLTRWLSGKERALSVRNGLGSDVILSLAAGPNEDLWVGTPDGLNHVQGDRITSVTSADGLPDDFIRSLLRDNDGTLWIGTRRGLAHLDGSKVATFTHANGLGSDLVGALVHPTGSDDLWIATLDGLSLLHNGSIKTFTTRDGLSGNVITALFSDTQGNLWIGTRDNGLSLRTPDGHFIAFHRRDLPETIDSIIGDDTGSLWLGTARRIFRARVFDLLACADLSFLPSPRQSLRNLWRYTYRRGLRHWSSSRVEALGWNHLVRHSKGVAIVDPASSVLQPRRPSRRDREIHRGRYGTA